MPDSFQSSALLLVSNNAATCTLARKRKVLDGRVLVEALPHRSSLRRATHAGGEGRMFRAACCHAERRPRCSNSSSNLRTESSTLN